MSSYKKSTFYNQPSTTGQSRAVKDATSQPQDDLEIESLNIINNLKEIIRGKGKLGKTIHLFIRCCSDIDQSTTDGEWLNYLNEKIETIEKKTRNLQLANKEY